MGIEEDPINTTSLFGFKDAHDDSIITKNIDTIANNNEAIPLSKKESPKIL